jgi:hypothetical protein
VTGLAAGLAPVVGTGRQFMLKKPLWGYFTMNCFVLQPLHAGTDNGRGALFSLAGKGQKISVDLRRKTQYNNREYLGT